ncbi:MAG: hypothetical protein H0U70_03820 [Tatlockia sp.]|nr:hypothetical protein [Tatlockia sp.]
MGFFNPFTGLIETKEFPHARAHRSTFWGKMWDTFGVFSGTVLIKNRKNGDVLHNGLHFGLFDFLTLGVHYALTQLLFFLTNNVDDNLLLVIPLLFTNFVLNLPRLLFAGAMTIICSPFVMIAQAFAKNEVKEEIRSYRMSPKEFTVHFEQTALPPQLKNYQESFIFIKNTNKLYYISGTSWEVPIKDIMGFRKKFDLNDNVNPSSTLAQDDLDKYFIWQAVFPLDTYPSIGKVLYTKKVGLEDPENSIDLAIDKKNPEVIELSWKNDNKLLTKFSLHLKNPSDYRLFKNIKELNIGGVQERIEQNKQLAQQFSNLS